MDRWFVHREDAEAYKHNPDAWVGHVDDATERKNLHRRGRWIVQVVDDCAHSLEPTAQVAPIPLRFKRYANYDAPDRLLLDVLGYEEWEWKNDPELQNDPELTRQIEFWEFASLNGELSARIFHKALFEPDDQLYAARHSTAGCIIVVRDGRVEIVFSGYVSFWWPQMPPELQKARKDIRDRAVRLHLERTLPQVRRAVESHASN